MRSLPTAHLAVLLLLLAGCKEAPEARPEPPPRAVPTPATPKLKMIERVLGGADPGAPLPTIIALHGLGDRPESFVRLFDGFERPARLVVPRGPEDFGRGAKWFEVRLGDRDPEALARGMLTGAAAVMGLVDELEADGKVLGKPILTGFSQGAMVTLALALEHPDRLGYALPIGGVLPSPLWPTSRAKAPRVPIRALHGKEDRTVPFEPAARGIQALVDHGYDARLLPFERVGHSVPPPMRDTLFRMLAEALERTAKTATATVAR